MTVASIHRPSLPCHAGELTRASSGSSRSEAAGKTVTVPCERDSCSSRLQVPDGPGAHLTRNFLRLNHALIGTSLNVGLRLQPVLRAWASLTRVNTAEVLSMIDSHDPADEEIRLLRAIACALGDDFEAADSIADDPSSPTKGQENHPVAALLARLRHWKRRDIQAFGELSRPRFEASSRRRDALLTVLHLSMESAVEAEQLRLSSAIRLAEEALTLSSRYFGASFTGGRFAAAISARLRYEQDHVDDADRLIRDRLATSGNWGGVESALATYTVGARIAVARGQTAFAVLMLREAEQLGDRRGWVRLVASSLGERVFLLQKVGQDADARDCLCRLERIASKSSNPENDLYVNRQITIARARLRLPDGGDAETADSLNDALADCKRRGERHLAVELQSLLACVLLAMGRTDQARGHAAQALGMGAAAGLYRTFVDGGEAMLRLLRWLDEVRVDADGIGELRPYLRSLIAAFPQRAATPPSARYRHRSGETLSARERQSLLLISHGQSNKRIAKDLGVTPETVKSHAKHILLKLAAKTRVEAVSRALSLGIL
jgi:ATP/maltotriose-dependent transcriptional regulator MalT